MMFGLDEWIPGLTPEHVWMVQVFMVVLATDSYIRALDAFRWCATARWLV